MPRRGVLVTSVDVPARRAGLEAMLAALQRIWHDVTVQLASLGDRGKFENFNVAMRGTPSDGFDWLIVVDDDVSFQDGFLDQFLFVAEAVNSAFASPRTCSLPTQAGRRRSASGTAWRTRRRSWSADR